MSHVTLPITLITSTPGGGKTALAVQIMSEAIASGRPVFVMGIPDLKLDHSVCPPIPEWTELRSDPDNKDLMMPYFAFPPNSLIVLDEAQRVFRPRSAGSKVPDHVAAFETVRHTGVTFLLITQNPSFIDSHIRKLVGKHIHLRDVGVLGRWYYEWPECANPENIASAPIKHKWKLPKSSFGLYKSSSMHIKRKYSVPTSVKVLILALLLVSVLGTMFFKKMYGKINPEAATPAAASAPSQLPGAATVKPVQSAPVVVAPELTDPSITPTNYLAAFIPVLPGVPESAPAYAALRTVKSMPVVAGCMQRGDDCTCYTQQGTNAGFDHGQCRDYLARPAFNPFAEQRLSDGPSSSKSESRATHVASRVN